MGGEALQQGEQTCHSSRRCLCTAGARTCKEALPLLFLPNTHSNYKPASPHQQMPPSANRNLMPQRVSQALFRLMLVKKLPNSYPFQGKNSANSSHRLSQPLDVLCRIQTSAPHCTYPTETGTEQPGVLDDPQRITAQISPHRSI